MMSGSSRSAARERLLERPGVKPDLALGHQALLALVHELDRVFDGDDVIGAGAVDQIDQAARVVVLPEPVGPVTTTSPFG